MSILKNPIHKNLHKMEQKSVLFTLSDHFKVTNCDIFICHITVRGITIFKIEWDKIEEQELQGKYQTLTRWDIEFVAIQKTKA